MSVFGLRWCRWGVGTGSGRVRCCYVYVSCEHLWCTKCSILLDLIDICILPCIYLCQISQIQTCLQVVVGPVFVLTSPAFMRSRAIHPAGPQVWRFAKTAVTATLLVDCVVWSLSSWGIYKCTFNVTNGLCVLSEAGVFLMNTIG